MPEDTQLAVRVSENRELSNTLLHLGNSFEAAARQNLEAALNAGGMHLSDYTGTEQLAMIATEELRLTNGLDLAAIMIRGKLIHDIEAGALHTVHPNHYGTLEALAQDQGISLSELSDTRTMYDVVFPYIENTLGVPVAQIWENMGKANFRTLVPLLRAIIKNEEPGRGSTRDNYHRVMDDTAASLAAANGGQVPDDQTVRRQAVEDLMVAGQQMTTREFQDHVRDGAVTPALNPTIITGPDGRKYLLAPVDDDQLLVVRRKMGAYMSDPDRIELPADQRRAQTEAFRNPTVRAFARLIEG